MPNYTLANKIAALEVDIPDAAWAEFVDILALARQIEQERDVLLATVQLQNSVREVEERLDVVEGYTSPGAQVLRSVTQRDHPPHVWCEERGWHSEASH